MSKSDAFENSFLRLIFNNVDNALIGDATGVRGSSTPGQLFLSLHTADPGEAGTQATSEATYAGYARVGVNRASGAAGFNVVGSSVTPGSTVNFPACTAGTNTITHFGVGASASGAGALLFKGPITPNIAVSLNITPQLSTTTVINEE